MDFPVGRGQTLFAAGIEELERDSGRHLLAVRIAQMPVGFHQKSTAILMAEPT